MVARRKLPIQVYPRMVEHEYSVAMIGLLDRARKALEPLKRELPSILASREDAERADSGKRAQVLIDKARQAIADSLDTDDVEELARQFAKRTSTIQRAQLGNQVKAALGVDLVVKDKKLARATDDFVAENVARIKSIPTDFHDDVEKIVTSAVVDGRLHGDVADEIDQRFGVGENSARVIARDQIGKYYGQVNRMRQQELGVERFIWRTVGDDRVRDEHSDLEDESEKEPFSWDDLPEDDDGEEIYPGSPIQCRCSAEPVFEDILGSDDESDDEEPVDDAESDDE